MGHSGLGKSNAFDRVIGQLVRQSSDWPSERREKAPSFFMTVFVYTEVLSGKASRFVARNLLALPLRFA